jgi:hypothetical protein
MNDTDRRVSTLLELLSDQIEILYWNQKAAQDPQLRLYCESLREDITGRREKLGLRT